MAPIAPAIVLPTHCDANMSISYWPVSVYVSVICQYFIETDALIDLVFGTQASLDNRTFPKIRKLPSRTLSQTLDLENFAVACPLSPKMIQTSFNCHLVFITPGNDGGYGQVTLSWTNCWVLITPSIHFRVQCDGQVVHWRQLIFFPSTE